jgi:hypothetical protein
MVIAMTFVYLKSLKLKIYPNTKIVTDTGYQRIQKIHSNTSMPKKKKKPLSNRMLKRFKIIAG